jgi:serine/threonine-protein kinase RsbW
VTARVELRFSPNPEHVRTARLIAATVGRRSGVPEILIDELKLATSEACARAVEVHRRKAPEELVLVQFLAGDGHFAIDVVDCGPAGEELSPADEGQPISATALFGAPVGRGPASGNPVEGNPVEGNPVEGNLAEGMPSEGVPGESVPSGLGLAILEGLVDELDIRPREDAVGTVVSMRWTLPVLEPVDD